MDWSLFNAIHAAWEANGHTSGHNRFTQFVPRSPCCAQSLWLNVQYSNVPWSCYVHFEMSTEIRVLCIHAVTIIIIFGRNLYMAVRNN